jgi:RecB family exonuclease
MRLLTDPRDASAAVRALARPPIELRQVDLARVIQIARRQKLEVVAALASALESPQVPPEARERIQRFLELHRWAAGSLDTMRADLFVGRLIERLGLRRRQLLAGEGASAKRLAGLTALGELAEEFVASSPRPTARALAAHLTVVEGEGSPWTQEQRLEPPQEPAQTPADPERETLQGTVEALREEVLGDVARIAGRLGELRLDTELDVSHGVVRYLELIKLAALLERPHGQAVEEALEDLNTRLRAAVTPLQREILESSPLDELLLAEGGGDRAQGERVRAQAIAARGEPTLEAFLPRRGEGLVLSASDVETYRSCPLRYKYARVLKIPTEQTLNQRFGIVVHQVLERFHAAQGGGPGGEHGEGAPAGEEQGERAPTGGDLEAGAREQGALQELMELLDVAWRRSGLGERGVERELREKARVALRRYHERLERELARPLWFERSFAFSLGPHHVRGRVDRVDALPEGGYELIDYKTGYAKTVEELGEDIQLSLYAIAAQEAWGLQETRGAYYYVLDDCKVPVPRNGADAEWVRGAVLQAGEGILAQNFEPTPSPAVCARCDYRIACPAAER